MSEQPTFADKVERNWDAFRDLLKRRRRLFIGVCLIALLVAIWPIYNELSGTSKMKKDLVENEKTIAERDKTIQDLRAQNAKLERQLTPFLTIAMERYPDVEIVKALGKFAEDMRAFEAGLESVKDTIRAFEAEVSVEASANWTEEVVPGGQSIMVVGESPSLVLSIRLASGDSKKAELFVSGMPRYAPSGSGSVIFRYRAVGRAGSWPVGARETDLRGLEKVKAAVYGLHEGTTADEQVRLRSAEVRLFVNARLFHVLRRTPDQMLSLPKKGPWPMLVFGGYAEFASQP